MRRSNLIPFIILAIFTGGLLRYTWLKWGDPIIDTGREMYLPFMLYSGKTLYRDISFIYGPFSPYFNASLYKLFGVNIHSLIIGGVVFLSFATALVYRITRFFLPVSFSILTALTFLAFFGLAQYTYFGNYNYILPYSYSATHSLVFCLAALYLFFASHIKPGRRYKILYVISTALVYLSKIEIGMMFTAAITASLAVYMIKRRIAMKEKMRKISLYVIAPLCLPLILFGLYYLFALDSIGRDNLTGVWLANMGAKTPTAKLLFGGLDLRSNAALMFKTFGYYALFCLIFWAGGALLSFLWRRFRSNLARILSAALAGAVSFAAAFFIYKATFTGLYMQYRCMPLIALIAIILSSNDLFLLTLSVFSLIFMSRILLHVWAGHYGFYLLVPGMILYHIFFLKTLPGFFKDGVAKRFFTAGFVFIFLLFMPGYIGISRLCYENKALKLSSERGTMYVFNNAREKRFNELLLFLRDHTDEGDTMVVFPEGHSLNFLADRMNPLYFYNYAKSELEKGGLEDKIISDIEGYKIDYVALLQSERSEPRFGVDYAQRIFSYIGENYLLFKQFGPLPSATEEYGIALFKRRE